MLLSVQVFKRHMDPFCKRRKMISKFFFNNAHSEYEHGKKHTVCKQMILNVDFIRDTNFFKEYPVFVQAIIYTEVMVYGSLL